MVQQNDEQTEILREILKWIRFSGAKEVKNVLLNALDTKQKQLIYHLSDGNHSSAEVGKVAGTSDVTVRRYWASWARQGIVESLKVRGGERFKKSFDLEDFGIEVPRISPESSEAKPNQEIKTDDGK